MNTDKVYAESIAKEYSPKNDSKVKALKRLDDKVKLPPTILVYTLGVLFTLLLGVGMCLSMKVIGDGSTLYFVLGIIVGVIGIIGISINYPIYTKFLSSRKAKYASDILRLASDIENESSSEKINEVK